MSKRYGSFKLIFDAIGGLAFQKIRLLRPCKHKLISLPTVFGYHVGAGWSSIILFNGGNSPISTSSLFLP
jgi:hypothetical protein